MDDIKMETQIKLETLFISLNERTLSKLDEILMIPEVDVTEKTYIRKYQMLFKTVNGTPSKETLTKEFPSLYFEETKPIPETQINDYVNLYIATKKNNRLANILLDMSAKIKTTGVTEEVIKVLDSITKSDTVTKEFYDVSKFIMDVYKDKDDSKGFKLGVPQLDELTRRI